MGGDPRALVALAAPDGARRAPDVWGHVARPTLIPRGDGAVWHVGHAAVGILPATRRHPRVARGGLQRLAPPRQPRPRPLTPPPCVGHGLQRLPAVRRALSAPAGGDAMPRGLGLARAPRRVEHRAVPSPAPLTLDVALDVLQAWPPAAPPRADPERRVVVAGRAAPGRHRATAGPGAPPHGAPLAPLPHPVVAVDCGTPPAPGRCPTQRPHRLPRAAGQATRCARAQLCRVATREHRGHQALISGRRVAGLGGGAPRPGLGQARLEAVPGPRGCYTHQGPPRCSGPCAGQRLEHGSTAPSTPHRSAPRALPPLLRPSVIVGSGIRKMQFPRRSSNFGVLPRGMSN